MKTFSQLAFCLVCFVLSAAAQRTSHTGEHTFWNASWIAVPDEAPTGYGVYLFRKSISTAE